MSSFWNEKYGVEEYIYGTEPNTFFKKNILKLKPGRILFPGEGEGRNAVYAAKLGWDVTAFDSSEMGKMKAEKLADQFQVKINYLLADAAEDLMFEHYFDCIVFVFVHLPNEQRNEFHRRMLSYLKPGGTVIFEGFSKKQIDFNSGGPKNLSMLFSDEELKGDFASVEAIEIEALEVEIDEGKFHRGPAQIIHFTGTKKLKPT